MKFCQRQCIGIQEKFRNYNQTNTRAPNLQEFEKVPKNLFPVLPILKVILFRIDSN